MLDFDAGKLLIIGVVALVVIGPKDLPRVLRQVGQMVSKLRRMAGEFQGQFMVAMKEADLQDLRDEVAKIKDTATLDVNFDPARDLRSELTGAIDSKSPASPTPANGVAEAGASAASEYHARLAEDLGTTSERGGYGYKPQLQSQPARAAQPATGNLVAAGIAPVAEAAPADLGALAQNAAADQPAGNTAAAPADTPEIKERRKILVPRRRTPVRFETPAGASAGRSRVVRPVRQETADQ
jgi:sec-independent protein translocase protein TatB